jgi:transposase-like protein
MTEYRCPICEKTFTDIMEWQKDATEHDRTIREILSHLTKYELIDMVLNNTTVSDKRDWLSKWKQ